MAPVKRSALAIAEKIKVLEAVDKAVMPKTEIAKSFGIPKSTLFTIIKNRKEIQAMDGTGAASKRIRTTKAKHPQLEVAVLQWLRLMRNKAIPIDGNVLKAKADDFAIRMDFEEFKASDGWLQRFKARHGLKFKKVSGESAAVDTDVVKDWKENRLKTLISSFEPVDVFNADETGLFYKILPDRTLTFKGEICSGGKKAKQRLTVLIGANMTGTEKLPLLVIGKYQKPRCFKGVKTLPVVYKANSKSWMTSSIFEEWLRDLDQKMKIRKRKVLLIIDNCTAHGEVSGLEAVTVEFLPPNATSVLQPMDQGIIQCFKRQYRSLLLNRTILCLDNQKEYEVDVLKAIYLCHSAWNKVSASVIANCFTHAGFQLAVSEVEVSSENDDSLSLATELIEGFGEYVDVDSSVQCFDDNISDEEIVKSVTANSDSSDEEEGSSLVTTETVHFKDVTEAIETVRRFLQCQTNAEIALEAVERLENVMLRHAPPVTQSRITDFFK